MMSHQVYRPRRAARSDILRRRIAPSRFRAEVGERTCSTLLPGIAGQGLPLERVSVNVSARQFTAPDFIEDVRATVVDPGLARSIEFEISESALLAHGDQLAGRLAPLSDLGCSIALDDFGAGFSSLAHLKGLPVHAVKTDRMFVEDIDRTSDAHARVKAMIAMSHVLGKRVVAEGAG